MASSDEDDPTTRPLDEDYGNSVFDDVPPDSGAFLTEVGGFEEEAQNEALPPFSRNFEEEEDHVEEDILQSSSPVGLNPSKSHLSPVTARKRGIDDERDQAQQTVRRDGKKVPPPPIDSISSSLPTTPKLALETKVLDPKVVGAGTNDKHVVYRVETLVNDPNLAQMSFDGNSSYYVHRRFSDFYWLRDSLESRYPGFIIPPLPDKTLPILQNNLSEKFSQYRMRSLDNFLKHVAMHSVLSRDTALKDFLVAPQDRFEQVRKPSISMESSAPVMQAAGGLFEKVFDWGQTIGTQLGTSMSRAARAGAQRREREPMDEQFDEAQRYVNELEPKIKFVYDTAKQLVEKNQALSKALHELGLAFTNMGQSEQQSALNEAITELGNVCNGNMGLSVRVNHQVELEQVNFLEPIDDYVRLVGAAKHALNVRVKTALAYEYALGDLTIKKDARNKMTPDDQRISNADNEIQEAQRRADTAKKEFELVTERVLKEIERFKREKSHDFKAIILKYVQLQIDHNQAVEQLWKEVLPKLHRVKAPSEDSTPYTQSDDV